MPESQQPAGRDDKEPGRTSPAGRAARRRAAARQRWLRLAAALFPLIALAFLSACANEAIGGPSGEPLDASTIDVKSDWNQDIFNLYTLVFLLAAVVFIIVETALLYSVLRFRRRAGDRLPRQIHGNNIVEIGWTLAPALLLVVVAIPTVQLIIRQESPPPADALRIEIIGHQFWWEVRYPDLNLTTANEIHIPVGRTAAFTLTSADVQHAFWVPKMGGKKDLYPNRVNQMHFSPFETGTYYGQCSELCGESHAFMKLRLMVDEPAAFDRWVADQKQPNAVAPDNQQQIKRGEQLFAQCVGCHVLYGHPNPGANNPAGKIGPNLTHIGSRTTIAAGWLDNNQENLVRWIRNPDAIKPGNKMIAFENLSQQDLEALAVYLLNQR